MLRRRIAAVLLVGLGVIGCSKSELIQKFASTDDQTAARNYIDQLRHHRLDAIEAAMDPSLAGPSLEQTLIGMEGLIPSGEPTSVTLVGAQSLKGADSSTINLSYEYGFAGKWVLSNVALKRQSGHTTIVGLHVSQLTKSLEELNRFTLGGKSAFQYAVLTLIVAVPLFILWTLVNCVRTPLKGRKWPWVLFILLGVGKLAVNWSTGAWGFSPVSVQLLGISAVAPFYGPWTLAVSLPLGAVVFLALRSGLRASDAP